MWLFLVIVLSYRVRLSFPVLSLGYFTWVFTTIMLYLDRFYLLFLFILSFPVILIFIGLDYRFWLSVPITVSGYRCIYCFRLSLLFIGSSSCFCLSLLESLGYRFAHSALFELFIVQLFFLCGPFPSFLCYLDYLSFHFFICYYYVFLFLVLVLISRFRWFGHLSCFAVLPFSRSVFGTCDFLS